MKRIYTRPCFSYTAVKKKKRKGKSQNKVQMRNETCLTRLQYVDIPLRMYSYASYLKTKSSDLLPQQDESYPSIRRE